MAEAIYKASDELSDSGARAYYRKLKLKELPEADRWIVKTHLTAIGKEKHLENSKNNRRAMGVTW